MEQEEEASAWTGDAADAERDEKQGRRTSSKHVTSHFLPVPVAMATVAATADTGRRKGRARSESKDPPGGTTRSDGSLAAT